VHSAVASPAGGVIVVGPDPDDLPVRVQHLASDGSLAPLEVEGSTLRRGDPGSENRSVAPVDEASSWVGMFHEYEIRKLAHRTGDTIQTIQDDPEWWHVSGDLGEVAGLMDQSPALLDITVGPGGTLWTVSGVPVPDRDAVAAVAEGQTSAISRLVDHVLRVHDAETGSLICEFHSEYLPLDFVSRDRAVAAVPAGDSVHVGVFGLGSCEGPDEVG
jgi:hypothetical protein